MDSDVHALHTVQRQGRGSAEVEAAIINEICREYDFDKGRPQESHMLIFTSGLWFFLALTAISSIKHMWWHRPWT